MGLYFDKTNRSFRNKCETEFKLRKHNMLLILFIVFYTMPTTVQTETSKMSILYFCLLLFDEIC